MGIVSATQSEDDRVTLEKQLVEISRGDAEALYVEVYWALEKKRLLQRLSVMENDEIETFLDKHRGTKNEHDIVVDAYVVADPDEGHG